MQHHLYTAMPTFVYMAGRQTFLGRRSPSSLILATYSAIPMDSLIGLVMVLVLSRI
jgi:hypothetical protein